jgi:flagellar biosynthesis/type III secretory pathway M-ring protein FliF/YscJ
VAINTDAGVAAEKTEDCVAPSAFAGGSAAAKYDQCQLQKEITKQVEDLPNVQSAGVTVSEEDAQGFGSGDTVEKATINLRTEGDVDAEGVARTVANMLKGHSTENVMINDQTGSLWAGEKAGHGGSSEGCEDSSTVTAITDRERMVGHCIEQQLVKELGPIVGGTQNVRVNAVVTLNPEATSTSTKKITQGALMTESRRDGATDKTFANGEMLSTGEKESGDTSRLALTVLLNSSVAKPAQAAAIRNYLKAYRNELRGDPLPSVTMVSFPEAAEAAPAEASAPAATDTTATDSTTQGTVSKGISGSVMAFIFIAAMALITVIALLLRKQAHMASERVRFENEFQHEQQLFQNYAQTNPDAMARELEDLLGAPAGR